MAPKHRGFLAESKTIKKWIKEHPLRFKRLEDIAPFDLASWRDARLKEVKSSTVNRQLTTMQCVFNSCVRDWGWCRSNPVAEVRRAPNPPHRTRIATDEELKNLCESMGYSEKCALDTITKRVCAAMLFSIETAMRCGEICGLSDVDTKSRVARLLMTKNGHPREVPLSQAAVDIWESLIEGHFDLLPSQIDSIFRKHKKLCGIEGLTFHDMRALALTRLSKKVDVLTLAKISGHRDIKMLSVYYRESAADIAKLL